MKHNSSSTSPLRTKVICLSLFIVTLLAFSRTISCGFVNFDDPLYVGNNAHVQAGLSWAGLKWAATSGEAFNWHPLTWLSHMLDCQLYGLNPSGHHASSVILHATNAVLAFLVLRRLLQADKTHLNGKPLATPKIQSRTADPGPGDSSRVDWAAAFGAALFALHPLRVESVAWIAERKDILGGLFFLLTLWFYVAYADLRNRDRARARFHYTAALLAFALGLLSKPMLVTMPFLLLLLDFWPLGKPAEKSKSATTPDNWKKLIVEKLPFLVLAALSCVITYRIQQAGGAVATGSPLSGRIENAFVAVLRYLASFFWPFNLCAFYPYVPVLPRMLVTGSVFAVFGLTTAVLWQIRRRPWLAMGWFWFLGMLVPVIGLVQVGAQSMADRYTYLPMLGLILAGLATWVDRQTSYRCSRFELVLAGLLLIALSARTWDQTGVWKDSLTLNQHSLAVTKENWSAAQNCGSALADQKRFAEALPYLSEAVRLNPTDAITNFNYAQVLYALGRDNESLPFYQRTLEIEPNEGEAAVAYASILTKQGNVAGAETALRKTLQAGAKYAPAQNALGVLLAQRNQWHEAEICFRNVVEINPNNAKALVSLGCTLCAQNQLPEGLRYLESAYAIDPTLPELGERIQELRRLIQPSATTDRR